MKLAFLVPDGVGVRNFIVGSFLRLASTKGPVQVFHSIPDNLLPIYQSGFDHEVAWQPLLTSRDTPLSYVLRNALGYAQMYWAGTRAMRNQLQRDAKLRGPFRLRAAQRTARMIGRMSASPAKIRRLDRLHCAVVRRLPTVEQYRRMFQESGISLLFCSHQRPPAIVAPVLAARSLGIPTATFIFSWDNITSKGRIAAPFDYYLVWSDLMRQELLRYYPDVTADQIKIVGTPQFDSYADKTLLWPREKFFDRIGANPKRPLIVYSGSDVRTCPEDPLHVRILMEQIRSGRILDQATVLLRPHPADISAAPRRDPRVRQDGRVFLGHGESQGTNRYDAVRRDYPELIYAQPAWIHARPGDWASAVPLAEDDEFMVNLAHHSNLCVNVGSTVTLDFAIHDKPVVNIAFDVADPPPLGKPLWDHYYQFEHYRPVLDTQATRIARSQDELAEHINAYLKNPSLERENRRRIVELEVGAPVGSSAQRMVDVLESMTAPRRLTHIK